MQSVKRFVFSCNGKRQLDVRTEIEILQKLLEIMFWASECTLSVHTRRLFNYFRQIGALWTDGYYKLLNNVTVFTLLLNREKTFTNQGLSNLSAHIPSRRPPPSPWHFIFIAWKRLHLGSHVISWKVLFVTLPDL